MPKPRYKTTNWRRYNNFLNDRSSLTFWIDEEAIIEWKEPKQDRRGKSRLFNDLAVTTALMVKRIFWPLMQRGSKYTVRENGKWKSMELMVSVRVWRKFHLAVDTDTHEHEIIVAELRCDRCGSTPLPTQANRSNHQGNLGRWCI
ncbi:hypothetical protein VME0621_01983 [Vibrio mediterranei]|nr:hypothetical protein VME0621_01983 [Vibrio mediterranei]